MASKIPGFTSGLKPPSTSSSLSNLAKRRGPEVSTVQPIEKRPRTTDDASTTSSHQSSSTLIRSKSVTNLATTGQNGKSTTVGRGLSTALKPHASSTLGRTAARDITKKADSISNAITNKGVKPKPLTLESRMIIIEKRLGELETENAEKKDTITVLDSTNKNLEVHIKDKESAVNILSDEIDTLKSKIRGLEMSSATEKSLLENKIRELEFHKGLIERERTSLEGELIASQKEVVGLKCSMAEMSSASAGLRAELESLQRHLTIEQADNARLRNDVSVATAEIQDLQARLRQEETQRRLLHNTVQELKGNIRVFCRIRPIIPSDKLPGGKIAHLNVLHDKSLEVHKLNADMTLNESSMNAPASGKGPSKIDFNFDRVFGPNATQQQVFDEISQLIQSALDGYNVCIFAYGQTGSGKTFTMEGGTAGSESDGMIPRSVRLIFAACESLRAKGWAYKIEASFLEIYNEQIRDLLGPSGGVHDIRIVNNETVVTNLKVEEVTNEQQVQNLLARAQQQRAVASTSCNEHSSRSHSVLRLKLTGVNADTTETSNGVLYMVDLAGSERLKESGATGDRLTETKHINKSLSNLGNVIMALAAKESHIPYRNSKLTLLLQQALGGSAKTLMFVNVSPKENHINETVNSLRFAAKVNACHIGTAMKNS
ncbi:carboxy-terminal kinesin 2-like isoform X2 [Daphnia pulex]|uniref:carboxy-terminal kinesin 2-like isoform X2 n=1 Tax=Daphnia pulex TaxID=6669 RepID=UPI001EDE00F3|nr:carboxy-terminal kinesin 2-like isoform X2 [Daphnia pulex]XP_046449774.1 carboxy-terminal kinesin 2-like isoform X2 [Daphnia pulex]